MKRYNQKREVLVFLAFLLSLNMVLAQTDIPLPDPGTTPDSIFYDVEILFEDIQLNLFTFGAENKVLLESQLVEERLAEIDHMVELHDYEAAQEAAEVAAEILEETAGHIEEISAETVTLDTLTQQEDSLLSTLLVVEQNYIHYADYTDQLKSTIAEEVDSGALDTETAATIVDNLIEGTANVESEIIEKKEDVTTAVAESGNIPLLEAEILIENEETEAGVTEVYKEEVAIEEIASLKEAISEIEKEAVGSENPAVTTLLEDAKLKLQVCENALEHEDYGKSFGQFMAAKHLTLNADRILDNPGEEIEFDLEEARKELEEEARIIAEDYERYSTELKEKYPDRADEFDKIYEESKRAIELSEKLSEEFSLEFENLLSEGKSEQEATSILTTRYSDEYRKVYGEEYVPPGFHDAGGFVKDYTYIDPISNYQYEFTEEGYKYTTQSGLVYTEKYPSGYIPETYKKGDEVHESKTETPEGTYEYKYFATGYEVTKPDGSKETFSYPEGSYDIVGGGRVEYKPTGFDFRTEDGKSIKYDYNPEFQHYVSSEGKVYIPPEGASFHIESTEYNGDKNNYVYSAGDVAWTYNPQLEKWESSDGKAYEPKSIVAPVGHEDDGRYITEKGEIWTYDDTSGKWESSSGETYTPPPSHYYSYDPETKNYIDASGHSVSSGDVVSPSGSTWAYDESSGKWESSSGETYTPGTGEYKDSSGQVTHNTEQYSKSGTYSDPSGSTWTYDSGTGSWTSSATGGTSASWTYDSGTGSWTSSTGESHTVGSYTPGGTYTEGTYTGGDSGSTSSTPTGEYSAPSGDSGGSTPSGDSGSTPSGETHSEPTGHVVYDPTKYRRF